MNAIAQGQSLPADGAACVSARTYMITMGASARQSTWTDQQSLTWPDCKKLLTTHAVGPKDGPCFTPATFRGSRRHKADADQIDLLVLDYDTGHPMDEIAAAVRAHGWAVVARARARRATDC